MFKKRTLRLYALVALLISVVLWKWAGDKASASRLDEIEKSRKALMDSLHQINRRFSVREAQLKAEISEDLSLIDQLSQELTAAKKSSESMKSRISDRKKKIQELWDAD